MPYGARVNRQAAPCKPEIRYLTTPSKCQSRVLAQYLFGLLGIHLAVIFRHHGRHAANANITISDA